MNCENALHPLRNTVAANRTHFEVADLCAEYKFTRLPEVKPMVPEVGKRKGAWFSHDATP
jgi:hypothetical protein